MNKLCSSIKLGFVALVLSVLAGCASAPLEQGEARRVYDNKVAATVYVEQKRIKYDEMVYKVLWNETRSQDAMFGDAWAIDADLEDQMVSSMNDLGFKAQGLSKILHQPEYRLFVSAMKNTRGSEEVNQALRLDPSTSKSLLNQGVRYLVALRPAYFLVSTTSMNSSGPVSLPSLLIVYDIESDKEIYSELFLVGGGVEWGDSLRNLEKDNLKILRDSVPGWLAASIEKEFPRLFNLPNKVAGSR